MSDLELWRLEREASDAQEKINHWKRVADGLGWGGMAEMFINVGAHREAFACYGIRSKRKRVQVKKMKMILKGLAWSEVRSAHETILEVSKKLIHKVQAETEAIK